MLMPTVALAVTGTVSMVAWIVAVTVTVLILMVAEITIPVTVFFCW